MACRARVNLAELQPGRQEDKWLSIAILNQGSTGEKEEEKSSTRDKLVGALCCAKPDKGCRVHVKVWFLALACNPIALARQNIGLESA